MGKSIKWALLSSISYLAYNGYLIYANRAAGFHEVGLYNQDATIYYAYANELFRKGNWIYFNNPFGTFDAEPELMNLYSSFLGIFSGIFQKNIVAFDLALVAVLNFFTVLLILRIFPNATTWQKVLLFFGQGIANFFLPLYTNPHEILMNDGWGFSFSMNQISSCEVFQHLLVFLGVVCLLERRRVAVVAISLFLAFSHPFNALTLYAMIGFAFLFAWRQEKKFRNTYYVELMGALLSFLLIHFYFNLYLPDISLDASFIRISYQVIIEVISTSQYFMFLLPAMVFCLYGLYQARTKRAELENDLKLWMFGGTFLLLFFFNFSYFIGNFVPEPAHWNHYYPHFCLVAVGLIALNKVEKAVPLFLKILIVVAVLDNVLAVHWMTKAAASQPRPPFSLNKHQYKVAQELKELPPAFFLYVRDSANRELFGDFEYSMMTFTLQKTFYGHIINSPHRLQFKQELYVQNQTQLDEILKKYGSEIKYLVLDYSESYKPGAPWGLAVATEKMSLWVR